MTHNKYLKLTCYIENALDIMRERKLTDYIHDSGDYKVVIKKKSRK